MIGNGALLLQETIPICWRSMMGISGSTFSKPFLLKLVRGTTVSKCYGCGKDIKNPPSFGPDDLVIVHRDMRYYRDKETGQRQCSKVPQNIHFHLRNNCILAQYPHFSRDDLLVQPEFLAYLRVDHLERLHEEFGWTK